MSQRIAGSNVQVGDRVTFLDPARDSSFYVVDGFKDEGLFKGNAYGRFFFIDSDGEWREEEADCFLDPNTPEDIWLLPRQLSEDDEHTYTKDDLLDAWSNGFTEGYEAARLNYKEW